MFIEVRTSGYRKSETKSINVDNIDYIEELHMNTFTEFKSEIVFKGGNRLATTMYKFEILNLINNS